MNIRFEYLYRDAGNYKIWGELVFTNRKNLDVTDLNSRLIAQLISNQFFEAEKVAIPRLRFENYDETLDHGWHEFHSLSATEDDADDALQRDIEDILASFEMASKTWLHY